MIKRYGLGANPEALTTNSMKPGLVQIVERKDGGYVRYEDYAATMESIGAGGVSGRITSKSIDEHRAEFELWLSSVETRGAADFERYMEDEFYMDWDVQRAWISWKAARGITE